MPDNKELSAATISPAQFQQILDKYPALLSEVSRSKGAKPGQKSLEELDRYRFEQATALFTVEGDSSHAISIDEVKTLVEWKLRHGKFRPTLMSLVSQNQPSVVKQTIQDGIKAYREGNSSSHEQRKAALDRISQLKGIGPATASLLLAVHFPQTVIFFSDEAFWWLCCAAKKDQIKYNVKEYLALAEAADAVCARLGVPATDVEKVAYVLMRQGAGGAPPPRDAALEVPAKGNHKKPPKSKPQPQQPSKRKPDVQDDAAETAGIRPRRSKRSKA